MAGTRGERIVAAMKRTATTTAIVALLALGACGGEPADPATSAPEPDPIDNGDGDLADPGDLGDSFGDELYDLGHDIPVPGAPADDADDATADDGPAVSPATTTGPTTVAPVNDPAPATSAESGPTQEELNELQALLDGLSQMFDEAESDLGGSTQQSEGAPPK